MSTARSDFQKILSDVHDLVVKYISEPENKNILDDIKKIILANPAFPFSASKHFDLNYSIFFKPFEEEYGHAFATSKKIAEELFRTFTSCLQDQQLLKMLYAPIRHDTQLPQLNILNLFRIVEINSPELLSLFFSQLDYLVMKKLLTPEQRDAFFLERDVTNQSALNYVIKSNQPKLLDVFLITVYDNKPNQEERRIFFISILGGAFSSENTEELIATFEKLIALLQPTLRMDLQAQLQSELQSKLKLAETVYSQPRASRLLLWQKADSVIFEKKSAPELESKETMTLTHPH